MGRPEIDIDCGEVERLAMLGLSRRAIAALVGCDESTLRKRGDAEEAYAHGRARRLETIAEAQMEILKGGNPSMAIWLGKNDLGQSDNPSSDGDSEPELEPKVG